MMHETPIATPGTCTTTREQSLTHSLSRGQRRIALIAAAGLGGGGLWALHPFLPALGWAVIFAVSLWPSYDRACARWPGGQRWWLPGGVTFLVVLAFIVPLILVVSAIAHDSAGLSQWLAEAREQGVPPPNFLSHVYYGDQLVALWREQLGQPGGFGRISMRGPGGHGLPRGAGHFAGLVLHRILLIGFMLLALFFLLRDGERVAAALRIGSRRALGPAGEHVGQQMIQAIRGTVNGLVMIGLGQGGLLGAAYAVAGVPHAALLGVITALFSAIPLGSVAVYAAAAVALAVQGNVAAGIAVAVFGSVVVFVADHFVRPVLIGGATRLPFVWVLLGILGGIEAWGLIGIVLGPALIAALMLLWREWVGAQQGPLNPLGKEEALDVGAVVSAGSPPDPSI